MPATAKKAAVPSKAVSDHVVDIRVFFEACILYGQTFNKCTNAPIIFVEAPLFAFP